MRMRRIEPTLQECWEQADLVAAAEPDESVEAATSRVPSLRNNFAWTFVGNMVYAGCQWGMLSVLAKLGSAAIVGQFTLGLAIGAPIFMFTNLQLRTVQATDVHAETVFSSYFTLRLLATLAGLILIVGLLPFSAASASVRWVVFLVAIAKCVECMSDVIAGLLQREEQLKRVAISLMIRGVGSVVVFSLAFTYLHNLAVAIGALIGVWVAVLLLYDARNAKTLMAAGDGFIRCNLAETKKVLLLSLPLGSVAALQSLSINIPRYFLQHYRGLGEQGVYASVSYLVVAVNMIVLAMTQSATTRLASMFSEGLHKEFLLLIAKLSLLGVLIGITGFPLSLLFGRQLLTIIYRSQYGEFVVLLAILALTTGFGTVGSFLFCGVTAARAFRAQVPAYFLSIAVGTICCAFLIPRWGVNGAGCAMLISSLSLVASGIWILFRVLGSRTMILRKRTI